MLDPNRGPWLLRAVLRRFVLRWATALAVPLGAVTGASGAAAQPNDAELTRRLTELDHDAAHHSVIAAPLESARRALERAHGSAKGASWAPPDRATDRQGALLRAVAAKWLDVANDLIRAAEAERVATEAEKGQDEMETKIVRGKALLEETVARRARTQAQLDALDKPKTELSPSSSPATKPEPARPAPHPSSAPPPVK